MLGHWNDYLFVLPDSPETHDVAGHLHSWSTGCATISYPSGRPWLVYQTSTRQVSYATHGDAALVLVGPNQVSMDVIESLLVGCGDHGELSRRLVELPGIYHVVSRIGGQVRVRGTATGLRRVFHSRFAGQCVVSDRPAVLAEVCEARVDDGGLALRLSDFLPHPLPYQPVWSGVAEVEPGYELILRDGMDMVVRRWWYPPRPHLPMERGARAVAEALDASVRAYMDGKTRISADLSGGLDSTSVVFTALRGGVEGLTAVTAGARDTFTEDDAWVRRAVTSTERIDHRIIPADDFPLFYADAANSIDALDEPSPLSMGRAGAHALLETARAAGSRCHLTGHGGDELFGCLPVAFRDLLPHRPLLALSRLNDLRHLRGWSLWLTVRELLSRENYGTWLARSVTEGAAPDERTPQLSWGVWQAFQPWLTERARDLIRVRFRSAAERAAPLAPTRGQHMAIDVIRLGARVVQALEDVAVSTGVPLAAPFHDDRVVEAVLSVRAEDRNSLRRYKPLLVEAMSGVVPSSLLERTTKDEMSQDEALGLRQHAPELYELWTDSRLAERGLVDATMLRRLCEEPNSPLLENSALWTTVTCEAWLRALEREPRTSTSGVTP